MVIELSQTDIHKVLHAIPLSVTAMLQENTDIYVAGGVIRDILFNDAPNDIDIWGCHNKEMAYELIKEYFPDSSKFESQNAITIIDPKTKMTVQFVYRWKVYNIFHLLRSFDFAHCSAAIYYDGQIWHGIADTFFDFDNKNKNLRYKQPIREEDNLGSLNRVFKFIKRGWKIDDYEMAKVLGRASRDAFETEDKAVEFFDKKYEELRSRAGY